MTELIALLMYAVVCASGGTIAGFLTMLWRAPEYTINSLEDMAINSYTSMRADNDVEV